jgi:hypothetical protein
VAETFVFIAFTIVAADGTNTLPGAREKMRYEAKIYADTGVTGPITWQLNSHSDIFEFADHPSLDPNQKLLRTKVAGSDVTYIPDDWGGTTKVISIQATTGGQTGYGDLQLPVAETPDNIDVAVLIDRSGSMAAHHRWQAAMNGAAMFAALVKESTGQTVVGDPSGPWTTDPHRAGLYWFWGNSNPFSGDNFPNPTPPAPGYPDGYHGAFVDNTGASYQIPDGATLARPEKISATPSTGTLVQTYHPGHFTALGSGLLFCRNALVAADTPGTPRQRVILALSDGMENREPKLDKLFDDTGPRRWFHENGDPAGAPEDPDIRVYSAAVLTGTNWANKLRDMARDTGGIWALDVKHITDWATSSEQIQKWFVGSFKRLFEFVAPDEIPDPTLSYKQWQEHPVTINLGHDKLIFYALFDQAEADKWELGVVPPGQDGAIYTDLVDQYDGIRYYGGSMFKMLVIDLPLVLQGHGHRWAGEWKMVVSREGAGSGSYAAGCLTHQDFDVKSDVLAPAVPQPGDKATVMVRLIDSQAKPIKDAVVKVALRSPGPWPGHAVALEVGSNLELVKQLRRSKNKVAKDTEQIADQVLATMYEKGQIQGGSTSTITLQHVKNGIYSKEVALKHPGQYGFDISIAGLRKSPAGEKQKKLGDALSKLKSYYGPTLAKTEKAFVNAVAGKKQGYKIELREQLDVRFTPTVKDSETGGYFVDDKTIRLLVQPAGKGDVLLGPGWADSIDFDGPEGIDLPWPAIDAGDGNYWVDIPFEAVAPRFDPHGPALVGDSLTLTHPALGPVSPAGNQLPLEGFCAEVLGVKLPLTVWALVGNRKSKEVHLITCAHVAKMSAKNKVWMHDLQQAKRFGYDTCEHCLPLVCNSSPDKMEAHKPFCSWVRRIAPKNRIEVHSWSHAKQLGFDGCKHCLPDKHTR